MPDHKLDSEVILNILGRMAVYDLYKPFRNACSNYSLRESIYAIWAYTQWLQMKEFQLPTDMDVDFRVKAASQRQALISEWELETLTREIFLNATTAPVSTKSLRRWGDFANLFNRLKFLEERISEEYGDHENILVEVARISHRQFPWQSHPPSRVVMARYLKIYNSEEINRIARERIGISIQDIFICGLAALGMVLEKFIIREPIASNIKGISEDTVARFVSLCSCGLDQIRSALKDAQAYDERYSYSYNPLRAKPLIRIEFDGRTELLCAQPTLLFWRFGPGLYYDLNDHPDFGNALGSSLQAYVGEVLSRSMGENGARIAAETKYSIGKRQLDSVDWIVWDDRAALFVEVKLKRLTMDAKAALLDIAPMINQLKYVAKAVAQTYRNIADCRAGHYPHFQATTEKAIFPLVVTLENWHVFGDYTYSELDRLVIEECRAHGVPDDMRINSPYILCSVDELEVAVQVIRSIGVEKFVERKFAGGEMTSWGLLPYLKRAFPELVQAAKPLFSRDFDDFVDSTIGRRFGRPT
ncbi:hypothetical protein [Aestuariivirga sp.]|uniref:hypothetical protein n=1 Tax=Aestuariivirga sp. TaxID=2650926 RepID=UPI0039E63F4B